jgi:hypothetical protein
MFVSMYTRKADYVEDLISGLAWSGEGIFIGDRQIIDSFDTQISRGSAYTVKQGALAIKLCRKYQNFLVGLFGSVVEDILLQEKFQMPLRTLVYSDKSISVVREETKYIKVTFPYNDDLVKKIRDFKKENPNDWSEWNSDEKFWQFSLTEGNILWIGNNLVPAGFSADQDFMDFYEKIQEILENIETHAPMLVFKKTGTTFKNVYESVPQPPQFDILGSLVLAKQYGINVWDEICENYLKSEKVGEVTRKFLTKDFNDELKIYSREHKLKDFDQLLTAEHSVMIVIPPDRELDHLKKWHKHINSLGYQNSDITVMFRTDNETNREFNEYIKEHKLNTPIHKDMKFVFVSRRIKKPLVQSGINFGIAISCDPLGSHINTKKIINDKYNTVVYIDNGSAE